MRNRERYIYFIVGSGLTKIGLATNVEGRLRGLQSGSPTPLRLAGWTVGSHRDEHLLHKRYDARRQHGEWFQGEFSSADIKEAIRFLRSRQKSPLVEIGEALARLEKLVDQLSVRDGGSVALAREALATKRVPDLEEAREALELSITGGDPHGVLRPALVAVSRALSHLA